MIKSGRMNESTEPMNESAKIRKMNKNDGMAFSGVWTLPSGKPGFSADAGDVSLNVLGDEEGIQIILLDDEGRPFMKNYKVDEEKKAVADFNNMARYLTDLVDCEKFAKKFGLKTM